MVSSAHLALSMIFLCLLVAFALRSQPGARRVGTPLRSRTALVVAITLTFLQIVLGALVKHTGASLACGTDLVLCHGSFAPHGGPSHIHFTHRILAYIATVAIIAVTIPIMRAARLSAHRSARSFAMAAHLLVLLQVALGLLTVHTTIAMPIAVMHLGGGALLLADLVALFVVVGPLGDRTIVRQNAAPIGAIASAVGS